ncbi:MAG: metallophosphoesterase [Polyangiaceae bacterium]
MATALLALHCGAAETDTPADDDEGALAQQAAPRDFAKYPVVVTVPSFNELYAVSDLHGRYDRLVDLFRESGLIKRTDEDTPPKALEWTGGSAILVVCGDAIDKGPQSVEVLDALMSLETKAAAAGGRVIFLLGNHEAEFLADPHNDKASRTRKDAIGINVELGKLSPAIAPDTFASADDPHGKWLRTRPLAAKVGDWFFSHGGSTQGLSLGELDVELRGALTTKGYGAPAIIGDDSILEAQEWYGKDYKVARKNADALGVAHIVFGHDPAAFGETPEIREKDHGLLFAIDTGLGAAETKGFVLHVHKKAGKVVAEAISHVQGEAPQKLWDD